MGKTHSKSRNYWMKRDAIIQISNYTCFKDDSYEWGTSQKVYLNSSSTNKVYQKIGLQSQTGINTSATVYGSHYSNGEVHYYFNVNQKIE